MGEMHSKISLAISSWDFVPLAEARLRPDVPSSTLLRYGGSFTQIEDLFEGHALLVGMKLIFSFFQKVLLLRKKWSHFRILAPAAVAFSLSCLGLFLLRLHEAAAAGRAAASLQDLLLLLDAS